MSPLLIPFIIGNYSPLSCCNKFPSLITVHTQHLFGGSCPALLYWSLSLMMCFLHFLSDIIANNCFYCFTWSFSPVCRSIYFSRRACLTRSTYCICLYYPDTWQVFRGCHWVPLSYYNLRFDGWALVSFSALLLPRFLQPVDNSSPNSHREKQRTGVGLGSPFSNPSSSANFSNLSNIRLFFHFP